jgi:polysaccharide deacetylase family protein (PEP-CTERM system associated)
MIGFFQTLLPFQGPCALRPQGLTGFVNAPAGSIGRSSSESKQGDSPDLSRWSYVWWKPKIDFVLAFVGLILMAPVILLTAAVVKLSSPGPAFYTQVRVGKNGRRFTIYKLRTMHHHAESATGPVWATPGDSRINWVGRLLRATHLDELPQLINVLLGHMSLIGPRPERPEIVHQLEARIDNYLDRLAVRPGITGLAQIHLPPDTDLDGVRRKLVCDLHYIRGVSAWTDFRILVCTALLFLGIPLRWTRRVFGIANPLIIRDPEPKYEAHFSSLDPQSSILDSLPPEDWSACRPGSSRLETAPIVNVLSIDVEDYYQVTNFENQVERRHWDQYPSRVVANTRRLLDMLDRHQIRATFFVLGWVGRQFPGLVREITRQGHEVGCHSYWHRLIYQQSPEEFREDLRLARDVLESAAGTSVTAYRAPSYSITRNSLWALDILKDEGFRHDSSIFPTYHPRYGIPEAKSYPHRLSNEHGSLWEFPPSVAQFLGWNIPVAGGGYFRLYPAQWTACGFRHINRLGHHGVFVIHPWEIDPDQPRLKEIKIQKADSPARVSELGFGIRNLGFRAWRHYLNLESTEKKLDWFLKQLAFGALGDVAERLANQEIVFSTPPVRPSLRLVTSKVG